MWPGLLAAAADRDPLGAELGEQPGEVAHPRIAVRLAVAVEGDRPDVDRRLAQQRHDREHVVRERRGSGPAGGDQYFR